MHASPTHKQTLLIWCVLCAVASQCNAATILKLRLVAEGFVSPTALVVLDPQAGTLAVSDQSGIARVVEKDGSLRDDPLLDLTGKMIKLNAGFDERGLLGLAVHPKFQQNHKLYASYSVPRRASVPTNWDCATRISEFKVNDTARWVVDPASERVILEIDKPYFNHNGGCLAFGPDGFLYISTGDGGNANGQGIGHSDISNGQDLTTLLGKILRIDVDQGKPYGIPKDNPFQAGKERPEIYAYGMRNPWRMSFDRGGRHELFAADIGQTLYEEIDIITRGGNYGWFIREGRHCFNPADPKVAPANCATAGANGKPLIDPILEYKNPNGFLRDTDTGGVSVMGGYVYRGQAIPKIEGKYVFGDWSKNWGIPQGLLFLGTRTVEGSKESWTMDTAEISLEDGGKWKGYITGFGEDANGELFLFTNASNGVVGKTGKLYKIVAAE